MMLLLIVLISVGATKLTNKRRGVRVPVQSLEESAEEIEEKVELTLREKEDLVYTLLLKEGFTKEAVCGIMGNISVECTTYDPELSGNNDVTYGLFQWNDVGDRKQRLKDWCGENNYQYDSIEGQVAFAIYEIKGGDSIACRLDSFLRSTHDAYTASQEFTAGFERCVTENPKEAKYTGSIYPEFYGYHYQSMFMRVSRSLNYYTRYVERGEEPGQESDEDSERASSAEDTEIASKSQDEEMDEITGEESEELPHADNDWPFEEPTTSSDSDKDTWESKSIW